MDLLDQENLVIYLEMCKFKLYFDKVRHDGIHVRLGASVAMGNVLNDAGAPYVIAIAIGAVGWLVTTSVVELKQASILEYTIHKHVSGSDSYVDLDFYNRSMSKPVASGYFTFRCNESVSDDCFWTDDPVIVSTPLKGVSYGSLIDRIGPIYRATAKLAPQSGIRYTIRTTSPNSDILMFYEPADSGDINMSTLIFRQGASWEGWLIDHYLPSLLYILMALVGILFLWVLASALSLLAKWRWPPTPQPNDPAILNVVLRREANRDA